MDKTEAAQRFSNELARNHALLESLSLNSFPLDHFNRLQTWQRRRLRKTYADLIENSRYAPATHFFLEELYGGKDIRSRDQDVQRVYPLMTKLMPAETLAVIADAFDLQALSLELDIAMTQTWTRAACERELNEDLYQQLYRDTGRIRSRERQLDLIESLGADLGKTVKNSVVTSLVRMLRRPARLMGFSTLQQFLEEGLDAFAVMGNPAEFMRTIKAREHEYMRKTLRD